MLLSPVSNSFLQVVAGGVARNQYIRKEIEGIKNRKPDLRIIFPPLEYCTGI